MAYKALYREWRPQDFAGLVGQDHISRTLQNAIKKDRIAHAYLFTGPRGTGKTSTAKIFAKAVNCLEPRDGEPCNKCLNCDSINTGHSLDVLEIDAASNRGIDEIREIRERVNFVPSQGRFKVYIIDEVHMLTAEAFNALLKTLEEPPVHVIFILATTEPQKIPATILSRCQRFDFRRISPRDTEGRLEVILQALGLEAEEGVLTLIVKKAEGGLRDAISLLDQCISFSHERIMLQTAYDVLGLVKGQALLFLSDALIHNDAVQLFSLLNQMVKDGLEPGQILKDLLEHFRNMLVLAVCGPDSLLVLGSEDERSQLYQQAKCWGTAELSRAIAILARIDSEGRWRQNMRVVLETALVSLLYREEERTNIEKPVAERPPIVKIPSQKSTTEKTIERKNSSVPAAPAASSGNTSLPGSVTLEHVLAKWPQVMENIKESKRSVHAFLTVCEPVELKDNRLLLSFKSGYGFHKEKVESKENNKLFLDILEKVHGIRMTVECILEDEIAGPGDPVQKALELFGPDVVVIKD